MRWERVVSIRLTKRDGGRRVTSVLSESSAGRRSGRREYIGKIFVVGEDLHREWGTMEIVTPRLQGANDGKKFAIIDIVIPFSEGEGLRQVGTWVPVAIGVGLEEDGARRMFGGVRGDSKRGGEVREVENRFGEEETFEGVEGGLARRGPVPGEVLLGEIEEGAGDIGVVGDEASVEIGEAKERANVFHLGWGRPACDPIKFDWIHGQLAGFDDHAKIFNLVSGELAFFELQMKVEFCHVLENALRTFLVEGGVRGVDEEIIHVDNEPSFSNHIVKGVVHESLKGGRGVGKSEEHYSGFEKSSVGNEGCFPLVAVLDSYVVVSPPDVELSEDLSIP